MSLSTGVLTSNDRMGTMSYLKSHAYQLLFLHALHYLFLVYHVFTCFDFDT